MRENWDKRLGIGKGPDIGVKTEDKSDDKRVLFIYTFILQ